MRLERSTIETPVGTLTLVTDTDGLCALALPEERFPIEEGLRRRFGAVEIRDGRPPAAAARAFERYFSGAFDALDRIAIDPGGTPFFQVVWKALRRVPAGTTVSYADLARAAGRPSAVRAVANANARNPIPIVVPCHRVIGSSGQLTGYGGGLDLKRRLLEHEGVRIRPDARGAAFGRAEAAGAAPPPR